MEKKLRLDWAIYNGDLNIEERYCHNCGQKVDFKDSLKRRQNANGKNIYHFAIYKCPKGHTWNKSIESFKAISGLQNIELEGNNQASKYSELSLEKLKSEGIEQLEISLDVLQQRVRLDKFLASKLIDVSRTEVVKLIEAGSVYINGETAASKSSLKEKDIISLQLNNNKSNPLS